jgi:hypothetical protein
MKIKNRSIVDQIEKNPIPSSSMTAAKMEKGLTVGSECDVGHLAIVCGTLLSGICLPNQRAHYFSPEE